MVEWKKLEEFATCQKAKNKKHITENAYSITQAGLVPTKSFFKEKTNVTSSDTSGYYIVEKNWFVYSPSRIDVGSISYLRDDGPVIVSPIDVVFSIDTNVCLPSYLLSYFFTYKGKKALLRNREGVEGTGRRSLPFDAIKSMSIPVPPILEQKKIMNILDTFTSSIENLKQQITQRRKQYEYYRDQLLDLEGKDEKDIHTWGEFCEMIKGNGFQKADFVEEGVGCIHYGQIYTLYGPYTYTTNKFVSQEVFENARKASKGDIIMTDTSENVEDICKSVAYLGEDDIAVSNHALIIKHNQNPKFLSYSTLTRNFFNQKRKVVVGVKVSGIKPDQLARIKIFLPSLSEQQRIVDILDKFEESIQNLETQLKLREKQYEYYRNKLLTFD